MRPLILFLLLAVSSFSHAATYTWTVAGWAGSYSSPFEACEAKRVGATAYDTATVSMQSEASGYCIGNSDYATNVNYGYFTRSGDSCDSGSNYNSSTGECEAGTDCASKVGQTAFAKITGNTNDSNSPVKLISLNNKASFAVEDRISLDGCSVSPGTGGQCRFSADGSYVCAFEITQSGQDAPAGSVDSTNESTVPQPDLVSDQTQDCSKTTDAEGRVHTTCITTSVADQQAGAQCGTVNGTFKCIASPSPQSDSKTRTEDQYDTTHADGSKTTTTDTTTTHTYCAAGACTSTSSTTTNNTHTDAAGNQTGSDTACTGADCSTDLPKPPEDQPSEDMPGLGGNPQLGDMPALPEVDDYTTTIQGYYTRIENAPILAAVSSIQVPDGGTCSVGNLSLWGASISFDSFCSFADDVLGGLRYLFLALWAWAAIRLFLTA